MGKLGYKPWELHLITFREVALSIEGNNEQNKLIHDLVRAATDYICRSGFNARQAVSDLKRYWPIEKATKTGKISERALMQLKLLKQMSNAGGS